MNNFVLRVIGSLWLCLVVILPARGQVAFTGPVEIKGGVEALSASFTNPIPPISPGQLISASLDTTDDRNPYFSSAYADAYQLTLASTTQVTVDQRSTAFPTLLYVTTTSGAILAANGSGNSWSQTTSTLSAGTYYIVASSATPNATGAYSVSINLLPVFSAMVPAFGAAGTSVAVAFTGNRLSPSMTIDAGSGITVSNLQVPNSTSATATFNIAADAPPGSNNVTAMTSDGSSKPLPFSIFPTISSISPGQLISGTLAVTDGRSPFSPTAYADLYQLTLAASTQVTIDQRSTAFSMQLYLVTASGSLMNLSGGSFAQMTNTLSAGTYYIVASSGSSGSTGAYSLSINVLPLVSSVTPKFGAAGSTVPVSLTGSRFSSPMTADGGSAISISNVQVLNAASATATFNIAANASPGPNVFTVVTADGPSYPQAFYVFPSIDSISPGQLISGALDTGDGRNPISGSAYADLYRLTLASATQVTIDQRSSAYLPQLYLLSASGSILNSPAGGAGYSQITTTLAAGTYYVDASSTGGGQTGAYTLSINVLPALSSLAPPFGAMGTSVPVTLTGNRFGAGMTVSVGSGVTVSNLNVSGPTSATATFNVPSGIPAGSAPVTATDANGSSNPLSFAIFPTIPSINPGQLISATLATTDGRNPFSSIAYADLYQLTIASTTQVTIDERSSAFSTSLYLLTASGAIRNVSGGGGSSAQVSTTLSPGTYYVVASSGGSNVTGAYTISINVLPLLSSVAPAFGVAGTSVPVTLTGNRFSAGMTVDAGSGITVSNLQISNPTLATATFNIAADAPSGGNFVTVSTADGPSAPVLFSIFPTVTSLSPGQLISGTLTTSDARNPFFTFAYGDLYQLTVASTTQVTIDQRSTAFLPLLYLATASGSVQTIASGAFTQIVTTLSPGTYYLVASSNNSDSTGAYTISINVLPTLHTVSPSFGIVGTSVPVTLTGSRFGAPMMVSAGTGITVSAVQVGSSNSATATFNIAADAPVGIHDVSVSSTDGPSNAVSFSVFPGIGSIGVGQLISAALDTVDGRNPFFTAAYGDLYQMTLASSTQVTIDLRSTAFSTQLYLLTSSGSFLSFGTSSGGSSQITTTLGPGTYTVLASSASSNTTGAYTISVNVLPLLTSVTPPFGVVGSAVPVTLTGNRFGAAMTVSVGSGITVSNLNVANPTSATATFNVPPGASAGVTTVTANATEGPSNPLPFSIFPSMCVITQPQTSGILTTSGARNPYATSSYADLCTFTLDAQTSVSISASSAVFTPSLYLISANGIALSATTGSTPISTTLAAGTYYIIMSSTTSGATGSYTLAVSGPVFAVKKVRAQVTSQ